MNNEQPTANDYAWSEHTANLARQKHREILQGAPDTLTDAGRGYLRAVLDIDRAYTGEIAALASGHPDRLAVDAQTAPRYYAAYQYWSAIGRAAKE